MSFAITTAPEQGCQMVYFQTKNPNLGNFWRVLQLKILVFVFNGHLVHFTAIWYILRQFGIIYGHLVHFFPHWNFVPRKIWQPCFRVHTLLVHQVLKH
jgi:hypothetical protein